MHAPPALETRPGGQAVHDAAPCIEDVPAAHGVHDRAPAELEVPAAHGEQVSPFVVLVPAAQGIQAPPEAEVLPAGQGVHPIALTQDQQMLIFISAPYWAAVKTGSYTLVVKRVL